MYILELYHHGIQGQKWGVRRFQNADGSLKPAGKKRYADGSVNIPHTEVVGGGGAVEEEENKEEEDKDKEDREAYGDNIEEWENAFYNDTAEWLEKNPDRGPADEYARRLISTQDPRLTLAESAGIEIESLAEAKKMLMKVVNHYDKKKKIDKQINSDLYNELDDGFDKLADKNGYKSKLDMVKDLTKSNNDLKVTLSEFGGIDADELSSKELNDIRNKLEKHYSTTGNNIKHSIDASGNVLKHHGILGQKWGVRRFQNTDGSLTKAGEKRYSNMSDSAKQRYGISKGASSSSSDSETKSLKELDREFEEEAKRLQTRLNHAKNLREYSDLTDPGKQELARLKAESEYMTYKFNIAQKQAQLKALEPKPKTLTDKINSINGALSACVNIGETLYRGYGMAKNGKSAMDEIRKYFNDNDSSDNKTSEKVKDTVKSMAKSSGSNRKDRRSKRNKNAYDAGFEYTRRAFDSKNGAFYYNPTSKSNAVRIKGASWGVRPKLNG